MDVFPLNHVDHVANKCCIVQMAPEILYIVYASLGIVVVVLYERKYVLEMKYVHKRNGRIMSLYTCTQWSHV